MSFFPSSLGKRTARVTRGDLSEQQHNIKQSDKTTRAEWCVVGAGSRRYVAVTGSPGTCRGWRKLEQSGLVGHVHVIGLNEAETQSAKHGDVQELRFSRQGSWKLLMHRLQLFHDHAHGLIDASGSGRGLIGATI